ncbi:hypothetical protein R1sor_009925 [Riccia sorocarpa]|uniref:Uncharacterized protein n=1 Tax=Riccia sorocarpa TaxID=122646 RepID=A0ABD3HZW6_9MARC
MEDSMDQSATGDRIGDSQGADLEAGKTSGGGRTSGGALGERTARIPVVEAAGEARPSNNTAGLVSALGGTDNFKTLMELIAQTTSQVALTTGNQLLAKFQEITSQAQNPQVLTPSGTTIDGSRTGTPISGRSTPGSRPPQPPTRRIRLDWNQDLLSLPQDQNNDVNAKVRLISERHFKIWDQWMDQPTEKKQECITELRLFYKGADVIPNSYFRDKFSAWGRNRRQYMNKNIRSVPFIDDEALDVDEDPEEEAEEDAEEDAEEVEEEPAEIEEQTARPRKKPRQRTGNRGGPKKKPAPKTRSTRKR